MRAKLIYSDLLYTASLAVLKEVKSNLDNSIIISIDVNNYNIKELSTTIDYIKSKGYKILLLRDLLSE